MPLIEIAGHGIGDNNPCFIVAEAGINHNGKVQLAKELIDVAAKARVNAVKFQTFKTEKLVDEKAPKAKYQKKSTSPPENQFAMLRKLELSGQDFFELKKYAESKNLLFLSTPFDEDSIDLLIDLGVSAFKIPSGELTNLSLVAYAAKKGVPMIVSTGMATFDEIELALKVIKESGNQQVVLLHCVSAYPAQPKDINLRVMNTLSARFKVPVGYSDHTMGLGVSLAAVALGACVIEKHFTMDRSMAGPDHQISAEPQELVHLVREIRSVELALGDGCKKLASEEIEVASVARKSLVAARDIPAGSHLVIDWVTLKRPGTGLNPSVMNQLIGLRVKRDILKGTMLTLDMFE